MTPPKSEVWRYFTRTSKNEAKCNYCSKVCKTSGNTSNLKAHLKNHKVKDEIRAKLSKFANPKSAPSPNLDVAVAGPSSRDVAVAGPSGIRPTTIESRPTSTPVLSSSADEHEDDPIPIASQRTSSATLASSTAGIYKQASIIQSFGELKKYSEGGMRHCKITQGLLYFICKDSMPFSVVDGSGFRHFLKEAIPLYKVPTRNSVKSMILQKYEVLSSDFRDALNEVDHVSITADVWSNMMTTTSYLGITAHFLDGLMIQSSVLGVYELNQSHTGDYLGGKIVSSLDEWKIPLDKVVCIATDNESAMIKAVGDIFGKIKHVRCVAHSINLLAESAIQKAEGLDDLIKKIRGIVKYIKKSTNASDALREEQRLRGVLEGEILKVILDVRTRWNSTYYMIERFLTLSTLISSILLSKPESPPMLTAIELETAREVKTLLSNLERLTREFSGDGYVTASMVIPLLNCFQKAISLASPNLAIGNNLKRTLITEFESRFKEREHTPLLALSMFLDPRCKNIHFMDPLASSKTLNHVKKLVAAFSDPNSISSESDADEKEVDDPMDLWAHHKSLAMQSTKKMARPLPTSMNLDSEVALYMTTPVAANHRTNPLELWDDLKNVYPKLYTLARKYLLVIATSVPSERLFSKAGNTVNEKRNRLSGKLLSKLLFLNSLPNKYWK